MKTKVAAVIGAAVPMMAGRVFAADRSKHSTMTQSQAEQSHQTLSCGGGHMAPEAAATEKRARLTTQDAGTYAAHARVDGCELRGE